MHAAALHLTRTATPQAPWAFPATTQELHAVVWSLAPASPLLRMTSDYFAHVRKIDGSGDTSLNGATTVSIGAKPVLLETAALQ